MKEHSGGPPQAAFIPITHWGQESWEIHPVFIPDPGEGDRLSDRVREEEDAGRDPLLFLLELMKPMILDLLWQAIRKINSIAATPLARDQLRWVCGSAIQSGETIGQLARRHGISKQAFQQGCRRFRDALEIKSQTARDPEARQKMRRRNCRRFKPHERTTKTR